MKTHSQKPEAVSHTIQGKTKAANQADIQNVLQKYAHSSVENISIKPIQTKAAKSSVVQFARLYYWYSIGYGWIYVGYMGHAQANEWARNNLRGQRYILAASDNRHNEPRRSSRIN